MPTLYLAIRPSTDQHRPPPTLRIMSVRPRPRRGAPGRHCVPRPGCAGHVLANADVPRLLVSTQVSRRACSCQSRPIIDFARLFFSAQARPTNLIIPGQVVADIPRRSNSRPDDIPWQSTPRRRRQIVSCRSLADLRSADRLAIPGRDAPARRLNSIRASANRQSRSLHSPSPPPNRLRKPPHANPTLRSEPVQTQGDSTIQA